MGLSKTKLVIPAEAGIQRLNFNIGSWTPAFAGVTTFGVIML